LRYLDRLPACDPANINAVNASVIDNAQRIVAACKQAGIYTQLNYYWSAAFTLRGAWGVPGLHQRTWPAPARVLMFDDTLKAGIQAMGHPDVLRATNPYTGIPLAQDPALAVIEIQNEDNFLWWWVLTAFPSRNSKASRPSLAPTLSPNTVASPPPNPNWAPWDTQPDDDPGPWPHGVDVGLRHDHTAVRPVGPARTRMNWFSWRTLSTLFTRRWVTSYANTLWLPQPDRIGQLYTVEDRYLAGRRALHLHAQRCRR